MHRLLLITLLAALVPGANAQRMGAGSPRFASGFNRGGNHHSFFYPLAYSDPFYSDYISSTGYPVASQPPVVILQAAPAAAPTPDAVPPARPLMIELRGDRYIRVSGQETSTVEMIDPVFSDQPAIEMRPDATRQQQRQSTTALRGPAPPALPPVVLVFRDDHREEVSDYTIAAGVLYARGDYSTGSWIRKIELSSLNLAETFKSNQSRGVRFQLPSSPNEVIVRP